MLEHRIIMTLIFEQVLQYLAVTIRNIAKHIAKNMVLKHSKHNNLHITAVLRRFATFQAGRANVGIAEEA